MVLPGLVLGGNLYTDSSETKSDNRLSQWGAGLEVLTDWVDFRANFYDASSSKKKNGEYTSAETVTTSKTSARTTRRSSATTTPLGGASGYSDPYAQGHGIYYDRYGGFKTTTTTTYTTTYRTETTHTTTTKLFERFEAGMDGWDAELGFRLPWKGPETRLFGGWYDYDNPFGEDVEGWKARLELKPGPWLSLDGELYENGRLHGSDWFVGARVSVPLSRDLTWKQFREGLFSMRPRCLNERMRGEMVGRDGTVHAAQSPWTENLAKRQVDTQVEVSRRTVTRSETTETVEGSEGTTQIKLADHITFVDGAHTGTTDGTAATPYNNLQAAADAARKSGNTTVFVYEPGGRRIDGEKVYIAAGNGGKYEHGVEVHPGITLTSTVSGGVVTYQTVSKPLIAPPQSALLANSSGIWKSAVLLRENTTLERMAVKTTGGGGILVEPTGNAGGDVFIRDSDIDASSAGIYTTITSGRKLGNLSISGSTISAQWDGVTTNNDGTMGDLSISGSSISSKNYGVATSNYGTMGDLSISGSTITAQWDGVATYNGGTMGDLSISGSRITAQEEGVYTGNAGTMGDLSISGSTITAQWVGVDTYNYNWGTMGGMEITGAEGKITGGPGYYDIARLCFTGGNCTGPLTVDGRKISDDSGVWNNP